MHRTRHKIRFKPSIFWALSLVLWVATATCSVIPCNARAPHSHASHSRATGSSIGLPEEIFENINSGQWIQALPQLEHIRVPGKPGLADFWMAFDYVFYSNCDQLKAQYDQLVAQPAAFAAPGPAASAVPEEAFAIKLVESANLICQSKYGEAAQLLNSISPPADNPDKIAFQFALAMVASKQGQYAQAVDHLRQVVELAPDFNWGYRTLGYVQLRSLREYAAARKSLTKALELNPKFAEVRDLLVEACLAQNDFDGAVYIAQAAISEAPKDADNYYRLAQIYIQQWRLKEAGVKLDNAIMLSPDDAHLHRARASVFVRQGNFKDAIAEQQKAVDLAKTKGPELNQLATLNLDAGNTGQAIENLKQALQADPTSQYLQQRLCRLLTREHQYDELVTQYREILAQKPKDFSISLALARALRAAGKIDDAISQYKEASGLNPSDARPHEELAAFYLDKKDYPSAIAEYTRALNDNPNSVEDLVALGYSYVQNNDYLQAEAAFVTALALQQLTQPVMGPTVPISRLDLMRSLSALYLVEGRYPEAVTQFEAITSSEKNSRTLGDDEFLLAVSKLYRDRTSNAVDALMHAYDALPAQRRQNILPSVIEALVDTGNYKFAKDLVGGIPDNDLKTNLSIMLVTASYRRACLDLDGAAALLNSAMADNPSDPQLRGDIDTELSRVLLGKGDLPGAEDAAAKAVDANPKSFKGYIELARVYKAKHDLDNAARTCRHGIEMNPYYASAYLVYGDILLAQGNAAQAADQYKRAKQLYPAWDKPRARLQKLSESKPAATAKAVH